MVHAIDCDLDGDCVCGVGLRAGMRLVRDLDGHAVTVVDPYQRCPYTHTPMALVRDDDGAERTIVNPGWIPFGWSEA